MRAAVGRRWAPPTPTPLVHVGARLLGTDAALALTGRRCLPRRLTESGFVFEHPELEPAVEDLLAEGVPA
jgi:NAD dependent epimerase/dehydratase family enzyme